MAHSHSRSSLVAGAHSTPRLVLVAFVAFLVPCAVLLPLLPGDQLAPTGTHAGSEEDESTMVAELTRLRAERERWLDGTLDRTAPTVGQEATAVADVGEHEAVAVPLQTRQAVDALLLELGQQVTAGVLHEQFLRDPTGLARLVLGGWCQNGQPGRALALLRRLPVGIVDTELFVQVGEQLVEAKDSQGAQEVFLAALRQGEHDWRLTNGIAAIDPEAGLACLRENVARDPPGLADDIRTQELSLLFACKRQDEARALLRTLMAAEPFSDNGAPEWMTVLLERAPALAVEVIGEGAASTLSPIEATILEASARKAAGDPAAAIAKLKGALQIDPANGQAWYQMAELDADAALRYLDSRTAPDAETEAEFAIRRAELLTRTSRSEEAAGVLLAIADTHWGRVAGNLLQLAPELAIAKARTRGDDELLGDAGDLAWHRGDRDRAAELWREAQRVDPLDGEWRGKLRRVWRGLDPFAGN